MRHFILGLCCLAKYLLRGFNSTKGKLFDLNEFAFMIGTEKLFYEIVLNEKTKYMTDNQLCCT